MSSVFVQIMTNVLLIMAKVVSAVGHIFVAIVNQPYVPLLIGLVLLYVAFYFLHKTDFGQTVKERKSKAA